MPAPRSAKPRFPPRERAWASRALLAAATVAASLGTWGCNGTTGQERLPMPGLGVSIGDAALDATGDAGAIDATVEQQSGLVGAFDAEILYADAGRLPHFTPLPEGGGEGGAAGPPWDSYPACLGDVADGFEYGSEAGACGSFVWTTSAACDACLRATGCGGQWKATDPDSGHQISQIFPPCNSFPRDASVPGAVATAPPAVGSLKYDLCFALYSCSLQNASANGQAQGPVCDPFDIDCLYCGDASFGGGCQGANGPCAAQVQAAFESTNSPQIIMSFAGGPGLGPIGAEGRQISVLLNCMNYSPCLDVCYPQGDGGGTP